MARTPHARDIKKRKPRKDKGKLRKTYRGKPTLQKRKKNGSFVPYESKRDKDAPIKLWLWDVLPMSKDGIKHFSKKTRRHMHKKVYGTTRIRIDTPTEYIATKEGVEQLCLDAGLWEGDWLVKGFVHSKNAFHVTNKTLAKVTITNHPDGLRCQMTSNVRLFRYKWFYKD